MNRLLAYTCALILAFAGVLSFAQSTADKAGQAASQAKDQAGQAASQTKDQAGQAASQTKDDASQAMGDPETKAKVQAKLQQMSTELNLTDDQKTQIKPVLQGEFKQLKALHGDSSVPAEQKEAKMKQIHEDAKSQISSILTPEQQKKLAAMREEREQK